MEDKPTICAECAHVVVPEHTTAEGHYECKAPGAVHHQLSFVTGENITSNAICVHVNTHGQCKHFEERS